MRNFFKDFFLGVNTAFKGMGFAFSNGMGHYFIYPLIITIILAFVGISSVEWAVDYVKSLLVGWLDISEEVIESDSWWDIVTQFFGDVADVLISVVLWVVFYFILHKTIKYITLILMSPFMALISEKTEEVLTGNTYPFDWGQFMKDIWRGVLIAIRNFFVETGLAIGLWLAQLIILAFVPFLGVVISPVVFVLSLGIGAYFWGFSTMDYTNERRRLSVSQSVRFIRNYKGLAVGNGLIFSLLIGIPVIGTYLGPIFATVMCTVGATIAIHQRVNLGEQDFYLKSTEKHGRTTAE